MKRLLLTTAIIAALTLPAFASGIGGDSITANSGIANQGTIQNSTLNNGSVGSGAFSPTASASSSNHNTNANINTNTSRSSSESSASAKQHQSQGQYQSSKSSVKDSANNSNNITFKHRLQAPSPVAPGLAATFDCLGSKSGGVGVPGFGVTFGGTEANEDCMARYTASVAREWKESEEVQFAYLCESPRYAKHSPHCKKDSDYAPAAGASHESVVSSGIAPSVSSSPAKH